MAEHMSHGGFESREYPKGRERKRTMRYFRREYAEHRSRDYGGGSMLAKMGICALLCGMVLLSNRLGQEGLVITASAGAEQAEDATDYLGKLRFVELPGIIQVFSSGARLDLGLAHSEYELSEEDTLLRLYGVEGQTLTAPADGRVKTISGEDGAISLELSLNGDTVIGLGNLAEAAVEEGQPLKAGDTLGVAGEPLEVRIYQAGRPKNPAEYMRLDGNKA